MTLLCREQWTWSLGSGAETAVCSWALFAVGTSVLSEMVSGINAQTDPWVIWRSYYANDDAVTERKLIQLDPATLTVVDQAELDLPANPAGASGTDPLPYQVCEVVTINTAVPGRSGRGRFYLPRVVTSSNTSTGRLDTTARDALIGAYGGYLNDLAADPYFIEGGVISRLHTSFAGWQKVSMGDVFDTQRSRRSKLVEARNTVDHV
jgi:hypothetical protein